MNKFKLLKNNKTVWTVGRDKSKADAISMANEKFKVKRDKLKVAYAWEKGDDLYFEEVKGSTPVWAVFVVKK